MTRFEEVGANLQGGCTCIDQAVKTMEYSCKLCSERGLRIRCDRCAIAVAHEQVCAMLMDAEQEKYDEAMSRIYRSRKVSSRNNFERVTTYKGHVTHVCRYD